MPSRRGLVTGVSQRGRSIRCRTQVLGLLAITVIAPLIFLAGRASNFSNTASYGAKEFGDPASTTDHLGESRRLSALEHIETLFPKEVLKAIYSKSDDFGPLNLNYMGRKDLSSSLVQEETADMSGKISVSLQDKSDVLEQSIQRMPELEKQTNHEHPETIADHGDIEDSPSETVEVERIEAEVVLPMTGANSGQDLHVGDTDAAQEERRQIRHHRHEKRLTELIGQDEEEDAKLENEAIEHAKEVDGGIDGKFSIWKREDSDGSDSTVRLMRDQLIMARAYSNMAQANNNLRLLRELKLRIKESQRSLGEANLDSELPNSAKERVKVMGRLLTKARDQYKDCSVMVKKLRAMLQSAEEHARMLKKQSTFLSQLAAKTVPKGLHCLSMLLTVEFNLRPLDERDFLFSEKLEDPKLYHYALFSDNVLAASVVVNSTVVHAKEPEKHVFHLVTDRMNFGAMKMWFLMNPPGNATIQIENVDDFKWLNSSYCPVLHQLGSASMKEYYFKADHSTTLAASSANLKYRNPKYLSMLNHLRFYLPEVFPKLEKVLFLDDDVVIQKDLSPLWDIDLKGNVNGAVETCGTSFHRFDKYLNFSNPDIARSFDPNACGWAYGMNMFDLQQWKKKDITGIYHKWQSLNEDRVLWKLGTLPPGLITFYNLTYALDKSWHVLGLGYNPSVVVSEIENAAVVHYNGNMKPWLEIGMSRYKSFWTKYVKYDHPFLQQCNIND